MLAGCKTVDFMELEEWLMQISIILFCAVRSLQYLCREDRLRLIKEINHAHLQTILGCRYCPVLKIQTFTFILILQI